MDTEQKVKVSAVVLTWNSARYIRRALKALLREGTNVPMEIIVVDNGSKDGSAEIVLGLASDVRLIRNRRNFGVAAARNQGLKKARGTYVLLLDSDTEMAAGSLGEMTRFMDANPSVGIVAPKLVHPDGRVQFSCRRFPTVPGKVLRQLPLQARRAFALAMEEELQSIDRSTAQPVDYVIGACQLLRRAIIDQIGLLDERIFYGPEDVDFCLRAWQAGWQVFYLPSAVVAHSEQRITKYRITNLTLKHGVALGYFFWKHRYLWHRPDPRSAFLRDSKVAMLNKY